MKPDHDLISQLNAVLKSQLTCINQCFLHARILKHQGLMALADGEYKESIDSMKFSDKLVERILALGGIPNMQDLGELKIGASVAEMMAYDLELKEQVAALLEPARAVCRDKNDMASESLLADIAKTVQEHIVYLQSQTHPVAA